MKKFLPLLLVLLIAAPCYAKGRIHLGGSFGAVPAPRLMAPRPVNGEVNLKGKEFLTFEWSTEGDPVRRRYYDFRIYKGYEMVASTLIFKGQTRAYKIDVGTQHFNDGELYTWAVRQVYSGGAKSRRNFASFTAIRR